MASKKVASISSKKKAKTIAQLGEDVSVLLTDTSSLGYRMNTHRSEIDTLKQRSRAHDAAISDLQVSAVALAFTVLLHIWFS